MSSFLGFYAPTARSRAWGESGRRYDDRNEPMLGDRLSTKYKNQDECLGFFVFCGDVGILSLRKMLIRIAFGNTLISFRAVRRKESPKRVGHPTTYSLVSPLPLRNIGNSYGSGKSKSSFWFSGHARKVRFQKIWL